MFLDESWIEVRSGAGGNGAVAFRREKHVPRGGPEGGSGGRGGDVVFLVDAQVGTLLDFKYTRKFEAGRGTDGGGGRKDGAGGADCVIRVPVGTVVFDADSGERIVDLVRPGDRYVIAPGGRGGKGNVEFASSVRKTPLFAQKGEPAISKRIKLELKLVADVGIVGLPNAGKSTLIGAISAAKPEIGDYPFTTLTPNLGVVRAGDASFVVADMPGLIEGAHEGVGLGDRFLRHIERTRVLLHLVDCMPLDESDPVGNYETVQEELRAYGRGVSEKPMLVAINKIDLPGGPEAADRVAARLEERGLTVHRVSAATGQNTQPLVFALAKLLADIPREVVEDLPELATVVAEGRSRDDWRIERRDGTLCVTGKGVERLVAQTDMKNIEAIKYLHHRLKGMGVIDALREQGVEEGDPVFLGDVELEFVESLR